MNKKILVIDDEPDMHELLKTYLERIEGIEIVSALSGEEGVEKYRELYERGEEPVLVVMDLNLSGKDEMDIIDLHKEGLDEKLDGVRATEQILKINPNANIWGYTAWFDTDWAEKLKSKGARKIFGRTTPFKEFAKMVEKFLMGKE